MISRKSNFKKADEAIKAILQLPITIANADLSLTLEAANLKSGYKLSYADAFAAALTIFKKAILITSDVEFNNLQKKLRRSVYITSLGSLLLPSYSSYSSMRQSSFPL